MLLPHPFAAAGHAPRHPSAISSGADCGRISTSVTTSFVDNDRRRQLLQQAQPHLLIGAFALVLIAGSMHQLGIVLCAGPARAVGVDVVQMTVLQAVNRAIAQRALQERGGG